MRHLVLFLFLPAILAGCGAKDKPVQVVETPAAKTDSPEDSPNVAKRTPRLTTFQENRPEPVASSPETTRSQPETAVASPGIEPVQAVPATTMTQASPRRVDLSMNQAKLAVLVDEFEKEVETGQSSNEVNVKASADRLLAAAASADRATKDTNSEIEEFVGKILENVRAIRGTSDTQTIRNAKVDAAQAFQEIRLLLKNL